MCGAGGIRLRLRAKAVRGSDAPLGRHSLPLCSNPPFHFANAKAPHEGVLLRWRSGWDSNPRDVAVKLISSQPRYDHFDTAPWQRRNYITRHQTLESLVRTPFSLSRQQTHLVSGFAGQRTALTLGSFATDVAVKLISSQPRYDHFDTAPWQRRNYITRHQTLYQVPAEREVWLPDASGISCPYSPKPSFSQRTGSPVSPHPPPHRLRKA